MQIPTNFIANSDYPYDQIVYFKDYELTTDGNIHQTITIAHGLGFVPLCFGVWSESQDFEPSYTLLSEGYGPDEMILWVESDDTNIYIRKYHYPHTSGKKLYLKIYAFAPISWTGDCEPTATTSDFLLFNTDLGYSQLIAAGEVQPWPLDSQTPQTGISGEVGKDGFVELSGRSGNVSIYYYEPLQPTVMTWKTTASTGRTELRLNCVFSTYGFATSLYPSVTYNENTGIQNEHAIAINTGTTRTGRANYNDITHFRVYA